ncbi:MAG: hypothetical protein AABY15_08495 [Nanoarchaeota archaeon]
MSQVFIVNWKPIGSSEPDNTYIIGAFQDGQEAEDYIDELIQSGLKNDLNNINALLKKHGEPAIVQSTSQLIGVIHRTFT